MKKRYLPLLLLMLLCAALLAAPALAAPADETTPTVVSSGTCGTNLTWTLDSDGLLTISGTGSMAACAFQGNTSIKNVVINKGATSIADDAFGACSNLESITIPTGVTLIGSNSFRDCSELKSITIPTGVTFIGASAFCGCEGLESVTIPSGVTSIEADTFHACTGLKSVVFPSGVTSIGTGAFHGCAALKSMVIPSGVTSIGTNTFYGCSSLESITMPNGVTSIGTGAFHGCAALKSVVIPSGVTSIGTSAFANCGSLESVVLHSGVTAIGENAFTDAPYLWIVYFAGSDTEWETLLGTARIFDNQDSLNVFYTYTPAAPTISVTWEPATVKPVISWSFDTPAMFEVQRRNADESFTSLGYTTGSVWNDQTAEAGVDYTYRVIASAGSNTATSNLAATPTVADSGTCGDLTWTLYSDGLLTIGGTGKIPANAFEENTSIKTVFIQSGVTAIGNSAFNGCAELKTVTIPAGLTSIGQSSFRNCTMLETVNGGSGITALGTGAFYNCASLKSADGFSGVTWTGDSVFYGCSGLESVTIPTGLNEIKHSMFYECSSLKSVVIHSNVSSIGEFAFFWCSELESVTIPDKVTAIAPQTFQGCVKLKSVTLPANLATIGSAAFKSCSSLSEITIPNSVTSIGFDAFNVCTGLKSVNIPSGVTAIEKGTFSGCSQLQTVNLPANLAGIGDDAFSGCLALKSIAIPSGVTTIGRRAFLGCEELESVNIPSGVTAIAAQTFQNCKKLSAVELPTGVTSIGENAFNGCKELKSVNIPSGVTTIQSNLFSGCSSLESIAIPSGVTSIKESAFSGCVKLTAVTLPTGLTELGAGAFNRCTALKSIVIPTGVTAIGAYTFMECTSLETVTIPGNVTSIGRYAFMGCEKLKSVMLPTALTQLGLGAFYGCEGLESIVVPNQVTDIGMGLFGGCSGLKAVSLPSGLTNLGDYMFSECDSLTDVYFVGSQSEWETLLEDIESLELPASATVHYDYAPDAPVISVSLDETTGKPLVSWTLSTPIRYMVHRCEPAVDENSYNWLGDTVGDSWLDQTAEIGGTYIYQVKVYNTNETVVSNTVSISLTCAKPEVSSLTVRAWDGRPVLTWGEVSGASSYEIYRSTNGGTFYKQKTVTATTYVDTSAQAGNTYSYQIKALASGGSDGDSERSEAVSIVAACARPTVTGAQSSDGQPTLSWSAVSGADKYQVYRSTTQNSGYKLAATVTATTYTDPTAVNGTTYYYKVHAVSSKNAASRSVASFVTEVTAAGSVLAQPTLSGSTRAWDGRPGLSWKAVSGAESYEVYRSTGKASGYKKLATVTGTAYADSTAEIGVTYYYKLHAVKGSSRSAASAVVSMSCTCARPVIEGSVRAWDGQPGLKWAKVDGADSYRIYRATEKDGDYEEVGSGVPMAGGMMAYTDTTAMPGTTYYYKVYALNSANAASLSAAAGPMQITADCARPTVEITLVSGKPTLSWGEVKNADRFQIWRSTKYGSGYTVIEEGVSGLSYTDTNVESGVTYYYKVRAYRSDNLNSHSATSFIKYVTAE